MNFRGSLLGLALITCPAAAAENAWMEPTASAIAELGARTAPPDLARQVLRRFPIYRGGVGETLREATTTVDAGVAADREARAVVNAIRTHQPFSEVVRRCGRLAGWLAVANQPLRAADRDTLEPFFREDYLRYVESTRRRFALARYRRPPAEPSALAAAARARGERYYDLIGREYRRVGGSSIRGTEAFDDRSTAFGIASLSFSHAVSDVAAALGSAWVEAGGVDSRPQDPLLSPRISITRR
jgi:hypothetical protein